MVIMQSRINAIISHSYINDIITVSLFTQKSIDPTGISRNILDMPLLDKLCYALDKSAI